MVVRAANGPVVRSVVSDSQMEQGYRSEVQERALVVSLQMFNLILERGVSLLKSQLDSGEEPRMVVSEDMQVLLPAIKVFPLSLAYLMAASIKISFSEKTFTVVTAPERGGKTVRHSNCADLSR